MSKKKNYIFLLFLFSFSIFCALIIGQAWDEAFHLKHGQVTLDYLFSFGKKNEYVSFRENYSAIYWSFLYLVTEVFPSKYQIEVSHLVNLFFSIGVIFGIYKVTKQLFNKKVGKIVFLILFFYPIFFGHMAINSKDTILAFCHVWIFYLILKYLQKQQIREKANKYIILLGLISAIGTGIQLVFFGSVLPIVLFALVEIFLLKKIINNNFSMKLFLFDLIKCFLIFYISLVIFWIDAHQNILLGPFLIIQKLISENYLTGWPFNLVAGTYYLTTEVPKSYFMINFIYKSPEYFLLTYLIFIFLIIKFHVFFVNKFKFFNIKLFFIIFLFFFPSIILFISPFAVYDGVRLFIWVMPYLCIIPGLTIYYLIENFSHLISKITLSILSISIIYFLFNFFMITPYQYTYLNFLNGKPENRYQKFENDYWATSIKELVNNTQFDSTKLIKISVCGMEEYILEKYLQKKGYINFKFVSSDESEYKFLTNRITFDDNNNPITCFDKFKGNIFSKVERNGLILSQVKRTKL